MAYLPTAPKTVGAAAGDFARIGSAISAAIAVVAPTTELSATAANVLAPPFQCGFAGMPKRIRTEVPYALLEIYREP